MLRPRRSVRFFRCFLTLALLLGLLVPALPAAAQTPTAPPSATAAAPPATPATRDADPIVAAPIDPAVSSAVPCGPSAPSGELAPLRTRTSRTYQAAGGGYQTVACPGSVNYPDASGAWQPIDNTLVAATASGYAYQNAANAFTALFPATLNGAPIKVSKGGASVAFALAGAQAAAASASGSTVTYPNALAGVSAAYTVLNDGVKENLTLASATAPSSFTFSVTLSPGLTARQNVAGGVDFVDATGVAQMSFAPPYATDSSSAPAGTAGAASLSLAQAGAALTVTLAASPTWLASPARVWPVVVDPQITLNPTADCYIESGSGHASSFCGNTALGVGYDGTNVYRTLLQFDLSAIPYDATIGDASLQLRLGAASGAGSSAVEAHRITQAWNGNVTWDTYDGTHAWASAGGDFYATPHDTETVAVGGVGTWYAWTGVPLVQAWVNGTAANDGVLLKEASEATANLYVFNSARTANPPALKVNWKHWTGLLPYWTYFSHGLTDRSDLAVNVANGNLTFHSRDLTIAGTGLPLSLDRFYNSDENGTQDVGAAWVLDYGLGFNLNSTGNSGIVLTGPNDYSVFFAGKVSPYTAPAGIDADLVKNGDGTFTLTWHATGTKDKFGVASPSGVSSLTAVVDKNGNTIALAYNADGTVHTITDTQGRVVTFAYGTFNGKTFVQYLTDSTGRRVQYNYTLDSNHNLSDYYDAAGNHTQYSYDTGSSRLTQIVDGRGNKVDLTWTGCGNGGGVCSIKLVTGSSGGQDTGPTYTFAYNRGSTPNTVVTDPNNVTTTYFYDALGRVTKVTDNAGSSQQFTWTSDNLVATRTDAYQQTTTYSYDTNNNLTQVQIPTGAKQQWAYADASHPFYPTSYTDAQGNATTYTYDTPGNVKTITDVLASQNQETINHNANGTVSSVQDFRLNTTSYGYDSKGNLTTITPPSPLGQVTLVPDSLSRVSSSTDGAGKVQTYTYDALDRVTNVRYQQGSSTSNIAYTFDGDGNRTQMQDLGAQTVTTTYLYDALNRILAKNVSNLPTSCVVSGTSYSVCYGYDSASNLTSFQDAGGQVTYGYNTLNEVTSLTEPGGTATTTFAYENNHHRTATNYPVNVTQTVTYDSSQRVSNVTATSGATTLTNFTYSYTNPATSTDTSLVYKITENDTQRNVVTFNTLDALNRLTQWCVMPGGSTACNTTPPNYTHLYQYQFDGNSNRTYIFADSSSNVSTLTYNAANEWVSDVAGGNTDTISWDAAGNELGDNGFNGHSLALQITYNEKNQTGTQTGCPTTTIPPGGCNVVWSMTYTGPGQVERVGQSSSAGTASYQYNNLGMGKQTDSVTAASGTGFVRDPSGNLVAMRVGDPTSYYYLTDGFASVINLVGTNGQFYASYFYCPTGNLAETGSGTYEFVNPYRQYGMFYDWRYATYWADGIQIDANSANARGIVISLPPIAGAGAEGTGTEVGAPTIEELISGLLTAIAGAAATQALAPTPRPYEIVYRVYGGPTSLQFGTFWTNVNPYSAPNPPGYRSLAGLPNANLGTNFESGILVNTIGVVAGSATAIYEGQVGGWPQLLIPNAATQVLVLQNYPVNPETWGLPLTYPGP